MLTPISLQSCVGGGVDALSVYDLQQCGLDDEAILRLAADQGRVLVTHNIRHFVALHRRYLTEERFHAGIIVTKDFYIGKLVTRLLDVATTTPASDLQNHLRFL